MKKNIIEEELGKLLERDYSLPEVEKKFGVSAKKSYYLIKNDLIHPVIDNGKILIPDKEIKRYLGLSHEERDKHHTSFLKTLGPGIITGASDDDPSGIGTYSAVGARYGYGLSWMAVYLLPLMTTVQETCARIGIVTGKGLAGAIRKKYNEDILFFLALLLVTANTINIGADIGAMVASLQLLVPISFTLGAVGLTMFILVLEVFFRYHQYARILKWLTLSLFAYIITGFIVQPDWVEVLKSIAVPHIEFDIAFIMAIVAIMGTTISPYLFFWQTSEEVEEKIEKKTLSEHHVVIIQNEVRDMRKDVFTGMSYANLVFLFIVITTAVVLHQNGIYTIDSAAQAASALKPLAGENAALIFTLGIIGVGLLAVPVLAGSSAYAIAELFRWKEGLSRKYDRAKGFYGVIIFSLLIGLGMNFIGINPIKALYFAAVVNGVVAPILLYFIFKIGNDKEIMGSFTNPRWVKILGTITTVVMGAAAIFLIVLTLKDILSL